MESGRAESHYLPKLTSAIGMLQLRPSYELPNERLAADSEEILIDQRRRIEKSASIDQSSSKTVDRQSYLKFADTIKAIPAHLRRLLRGWISAYLDICLNNSETLMNKLKKTLTIIAASVALTACQPEVGSPEWCKMMKEKDKGQWTLDEGKDFLKHCVIPKDEE